MDASHTTRRDARTEPVWKALETVADPEIPVLNLVEMGIVRAVAATDAGVTVTLVPTFSGCPALEVMKRDVREELEARGYRDVRVEVVLSPPWSTDMLSDEARRKLREFGLAPPARHGGLIDLDAQAPTPCPHCGSVDTRLTSAFGSTLCREIYVCDGCREPFEGFKPL